MKNDTHVLLAFAYFIESLTFYRKVKSFVYDLLENDKYPYKKYFDFLFDPPYNSVESKYEIKIKRTSFTTT